MDCRGFLVSSSDSHGHHKGRAVLALELDRAPGLETVCRDTDISGAYCPDGIFQVSGIEPEMDMLAGGSVRLDGHAFPCLGARFSIGRVSLRFSFYWLRSGGMGCSTWTLRRTGAVIGCHVKVLTTARHVGAYS